MDATEVAWLYSYLQLLVLYSEHYIILDLQWFYQIPDIFLWLITTELLIAGQ